MSCKKENAIDCFKSNGTEITQVRKPGSFQVISLYTKMDLLIRQGSEFKLEVSAGKNVIKNISTTVVNDTLMIDNNNKCNFVRGYKKNIQITITVPYIKQIINNGVGTIRTAENFSQDTLVVTAESSGDLFINGNYYFLKTSSNGNGDVYLNGITNRLSVFMNGTNYLKADELIVKDYAFVETASLGDSYINAKQLKKLEYKIYKSGRVFYKGLPTEILNLSEDISKEAIQID